MRKVSTEFNKESIVCVTSCISCSRGRHVPVPYIWITYAGAGVHTCEHTRSSPLRSSARSHEQPSIRAEKTPSEFTIQIRCTSLSGLRHDGVLYILCYWICLKLFKFERKKMFCRCLQ